MAQPVYSERFILSALPLGGNVSYTVPAGFRAVIKQITVTALTSAGTLVWVAIAPGVLVEVFVLTPASPPGSQPASERSYVAHAGDQINAYERGVGNADIYVGGYLLSLP